MKTVGLEAEAGAETFILSIRISTALASAKQDIIVDRPSEKSDEDRAVRSG
jgi:hypothetical protein